MYLTTLSIHCSMPRCDALHRVEGNSNVGTLESSARKLGWKTGLGSRHLCPDHNPEGDTEEDSDG